MNYPIESQFNHCILSYSLKEEKGRYSELIIKLICKKQKKTINQPF